MEEDKELVQMSPTGAEREGEEEIDYWNISDKVESNEQTMCQLYSEMKKSGKALVEGILLPFKFPQLFVDSRAPPKTFLLYGPRGSGKEHAIRKIVNHAEASLVVINCPKTQAEWEQGRACSSQTLEQCVKSCFKTCPGEK